MKSSSQTRIIDITQMLGYEEYLNRCLSGPPSKSCRRRIEYLKKSIPRGFHKKLVIHNEEVVGQIEYSPPDVSYYPIVGENLIVVNCIWVLRKAKGHGFGRKLLENMIESEKDAFGFATIALENHWSPWFRKDQMEKLGFRALDSIRVTHKTKHPAQVFSIYLMWMPNTREAKVPMWNRHKLLEGLSFCTAHPLYRSQTRESKQILEKR